MRRFVEKIWKNFSQATAVHRHPDLINRRIDLHYCNTSFVSATKKYSILKNKDLLCFEIAKQIFS